MSPAATRSATLSAAEGLAGQIRDHAQQLTTLQSELNQELQLQVNEVNRLASSLAAINAEVRSSDIAARFGGEEFVILLPRTSSAEGRHVAERVRQAVAAAPFDLPAGGQVAVTVSIGIAEFHPGAGRTDLKSLGEALIARADAALYDAKAAGRDRVVVEAA